MFISKEEIKNTTGIDIDLSRLLLAQAMIETYIGKSEVEIEDAEDLDALGKATMFQALYIKDNPWSVLEQAGLKTITDNTSTTTFTYEQMSPFMSPWAVKACSRLSWTGTRSIHFGSVYDRRPPVGWEYS